MKKDLFTRNTPDKFWQCSPSISAELWQEAVEQSLVCLQSPSASLNADNLLAYIYGEESYGVNSWQLSRMRRFYYMLKPYIPRSVITSMRLHYHTAPQSDPDWFIDDRYVKFIWAMLDYVTTRSSSNSLSYRALWRDQKQFAFALTHDIETAQGQAQARELADIDESFGFRSAFYFVPERYKLDYDLIDELRERGFEIGIHGLKHDGKLFFSREIFMERAKRINHYIKQLDAVGFAAPLTHRNGEWMQALEIEYDRSFFDIDPHEPMPGGVMTIYPYFLGHFVELPYTLLQDHTLTNILGETTPRLWLEKLDFIRKYRGMALLNTHPDYLRLKDTKRVYIEFLQAISTMDNCWHALPRDVARWWRERDESSSSLTTHTLQRSPHSSKIC